MPVGALLAVFGFLLGRAAAVGAGNVFLLLGLGLHLVLFRARTAAAPEGYAVDEDVLEVAFFAHLFNA